MNALMYGGAEAANQITGDPRAGRDALMIAQLLPMATRSGPVQSSILAERASVVAPRVNPLMDSFNRMEAQRVTEPSRPPPPDSVASNIARVQAQLGVRDAPPPSPDMTATPAERAPGFVPRVNIDPLTGEATPTQVPTDLRLRAAIEAVPAKPPPGFVPPGERAPSVAPGAAGPATLPPYAPEAAPPEPPAPRSVGAAASREQTPASVINLTPEQAALYGSVADKQWLYKTMRPGEAIRPSMSPASRQPWRSANRRCRRPGDQDHAQSVAGRRSGGTRTTRRAQYHS